MREAWIASGKKDLAERAYAEAERIIATHKVPPLPNGGTMFFDALGIGGNAPQTALFKLFKLVSDRV